MAQTDIQHALFMKRLGLVNSFYTITEISKMVNMDCSGVLKAINNMLKTGFVDKNISGGWSKAYRLSDAGFIKIQKIKAGGENGY